MAGRARILSFSLCCWGGGGVEVAEWGSLTLRVQHTRLTQSLAPPEGYGRPFEQYLIFPMPGGFRVSSSFLSLYHFVLFHSFIYHHVLLLFCTSFIYLFILFYLFYSLK